MVGMSNPARFSPGLLHSSCVICISTLCRSVSEPAVSALARKNLRRSGCCSLTLSTHERRQCSGKEYSYQSKVDLTSSLLYQVIVVSRTMQLLWKYTWGHRGGGGGGGAREIQR